MMYNYVILSSGIRYSCVPRVEPCEVNLKNMDSGTITGVVALIVVAILAGALTVGCLLSAKKKDDKSYLSFASLAAVVFVCLLWLIPATIQDRNNDVKHLMQARAELLGNYPEIRGINELHLTEQTIVYRRIDGRSCYSNLVHIKSARQHWVIDKHSTVCTVAK